MPLGRRCDDKTNTAGGTDSAPTFARALEHDSGLLARFLYSLPESMLGRRALSPEPVLPEIARGYRDLIRSALDLTPATTAGGKPTPHIVRPSPQAANEVQ